MGRKVAILTDTATISDSITSLWHNIISIEVIQGSSRKWLEFPYNVT